MVAPVVHELPLTLKELIQQGLREARSKPPLGAAAGFLRVSSLAELCAREEGLCARYGVTRQDTIDAELLLTFSVGHAVHWALQNKVLPNVGALLGSWKCLRCAAVHGAQVAGQPVEAWAVPRPPECQCGGQDFLYEEARFESPEFRVAGHPDGFLRVPGLPGLGLLEAKTISRYKVADVRKIPQANHLVQVQTYLWLTGLQWAKVLYWEKGQFGLGGLIEHTVERDEEHIDSIKAMVRSIWDAVYGGPVADRICEDAGCDRAKDCSVVDLCFADRAGEGTTTR